MTGWKHRQFRLGHIGRRPAVAFVLLLVCTLALWGSTPARAMGGETAVDAELVLAVDVSYSMDEEEQRLQRGGYIAALTSKEFAAALRSGPHGKIAIAYVEWASYYDARVLIDWTVIDSPESARMFSEKLAEAPYRRARRTSISGAIDFSVKMFERNGFEGLRRIIDISGDGPNNDGRHVTRARDDALARGFVINGLPVMLNRPNFGYMEISNLDEYYQDCVVGGPGSFLVPIKERDQFVSATRTKLVLEVASAPLPQPTMQGLLPVTRAQTAKPRVACTVGEMMWQQRMGN